MPCFPLIAVDVGNARTKFGLFGQSCGALLPEPAAVLHLSNDAPLGDRLSQWLEGRAPPAGCRWHIASVNRDAASRLIDWLCTSRSEDRASLLAAGDLPLTVDLDRPDMVGVDRLLDALAANTLRTPGRPAVVIDVGTAITVDLLSADGTFRGGAILPGIAMTARALYEFTDLLPLVDMTELSAPPEALGRETEAAMRSGLFWGAVGGIRQLIEQLAPGQSPDVFLTGGAGQAVAGLLPAGARLIPHLTLAGIAIAAR